jgi:soluble lytic murein transglycosylase-like protein
MRRSTAAIVAMSALLTACGLASGDDRRVARQAPTAEATDPGTAAPIESPPPPRPPPDPLALPASGPPVAPDDPAALAALLAAAEGAVRDPARAPQTLGAAGQWQQVLYRKLGSRPELLEAVVTALPPDLHGPVRANVFAGARLADMHKPQPAAPGAPPKELQLPSWRIVPPPPADELKTYYQQAEAATGVHWTYLAAVNLVETRMGRIRGTSSAGALGPMQFMPATWGEWGEGDVHSPRDAILAAARFLRWGGMPADPNRAIFRYNRDVRYVDAVRTYAEQMQADPRAFYGYYHWQVFFGPHWLPEGYDGSAA